MFYRLKFNSIYIAFLVCVIFFLVTFHNFSISNYFTIDYASKYYVKSHSYDDIVLDMTRLALKLEMWNYNYSNSDVDELEDLVLESGGSPIRTIIVSTWRSGSSFLGDLINAVPGNFYSFEPLMMFGTYSQIRGPPNATRAITLLKNLLTCNYKNETDIEMYLTNAKSGMETVAQFNRNVRFWRQCNIKQKLCFDGDFMGKSCKIFPFQTIKLARLRLPFLKSLLDDARLNVKVVFLVRDPRGVIQSRRRIRNFCSAKNVPDCADASLLCSDMLIDYKAAASFRRKYPNKFTVLRYEDLALNLKETTDSLLNFLRMDPTASVQEFLKSHTSISNTLEYSTFRITKNIPFKWKRTLRFRAVEEIQGKCRQAMAFWGYGLAENASHLASSKFNPLLHYSLY